MERADRGGKELSRHAGSAYSFDKQNRDMKRCLENVQGVLLGAMFFFLGLSLLAMPQNRLLADDPGGGGLNVPRCPGNSCKNTSSTCRLKNSRDGCVTQNTNDGCSANPNVCQMCFCRYSSGLDQFGDPWQSCDCAP